MRGERGRSRSHSAPLLPRFGARELLFCWRTSTTFPQLPSIRSPSVNLHLGELPCRGGRGVRGQPVTHGFCCGQLCTWNSSECQVLATDIKVKAKKEEAVSQRPPSRSVRVPRGPDGQLAWPTAISPRPPGPAHLTPSPITQWPGACSSQPEAPPAFLADSIHGRSFKKLPGCYLELCATV